MDDAIDIFLKRTGDTLPKSQHRAELTRYQQQFHTENTVGKPLGWQSEKDWDRMLTILERYGGMTGRKPVPAYFTNQYLPAQ
jgi:NitT/TauT family transport system substrate-binding protein